LSIRFVKRRAFVLSALMLLAAAVPASALPPVAPLAGRPIRLEGYWGRSRRSPDVIGEVSVAMTGRKPRSFGVTAVQAYHPEEEGAQLFRFTSDHPVALLVRGDDDMVRRFMEAPPDARVTAFGTYTAGSGLFVLGSVDVTVER
jgi:hypothetical protein